MKRTVLNLGAILIAFIIGIAINNACADSLEKMSDSELRNLVARLQEEVNSLKKKVSQLEANSGDDNVGGFFIVDGVRFCATGTPAYNNTKSYSMKQTVVNNGQTTTTELSFNGAETKYDTKGRLVSSISRATDYDSETTYVYNGKKVTNTTKMTYKTMDYVSTVVYEYEYE